MPSSGICRLSMYGSTNPQYRIVGKLVGIKFANFGQNTVFLNLAKSKILCNHYNLSLMASCHLKAADKCYHAVVGQAVSAPYLPISALSTGVYFAWLWGEDACRAAACFPQNTLISNTNLLPRERRGSPISHWLWGVHRYFLKYWYST